MADQKQQKDFLQKLRASLGVEKLETLLPMQEDLLNRAFQRMLNRKKVSAITPEEIKGTYDRITSQVYPVLPLPKKPFCE